MKYQDMKGNHRIDEFTKPPYICLVCGKEHIHPGDCARCSHGKTK